MIRIQQESISVVDATTIAAAGFLQPYNPRLEKDVGEHLGDGNVRIIYDGEERVGFVVYKALEDVLYIGGIIILPQVQAHGYAFLVIQELLRLTGAQFLVYRTQSARMWSVGQKLCRSWYPDPDKEPDTEFRGKIDSICELMGLTGFPVISGFYGGSLYGEKPVHNNTMIQSWWDGLCVFENGDAVICVGVI